MFSETAIIILQFLATILMGYDYFISERLKSYIDDNVETYLKNAKGENKEYISTLVNEKSILKPYFFATCIFIYLTLILYMLMKLSSLYQWHWGFIIIFSLGFIFAAYTVMYGMVKLIGKSLLPLAMPILTNVLLSFLIFSPKRAIAMAGMLLLLLSFIFRLLPQTMS